VAYDSHLRTPQPLPSIRLPYYSFKTGCKDHESWHEQ